MSEATTPDSEQTCLQPRLFPPDPQEVPHRPRRPGNQALAVNPRSPTVRLGNETATFLHEKNPGRGVPRIEKGVNVHVEAAASCVSEAERGAAHQADRLHAGPDLADQIEQPRRPLVVVAEVDAERRRSKRWRRGDGARLAVYAQPAALCREEVVAGGGCVSEAEDRLAVAAEGDREAELRNPLRVVVRTVDRVDHPRPSRTGVDFVLVPSRPAKLTLSLTDAAGAPATGMINLLLPGDAPGSILANQGVPMSPALPRITSTLEPGEWIAVVLGHARSIARITLSSGEETSLTLTLGSGARIAGRVVFDGSSASPPRASVRLGVRGVGPDAIVPPPGLSNGPVAVKTDGSFEMSGVVGTIELQPASALPGWTLRAVRYGDRDLLDEPLTLSGGEDISGVQVVFTDQVGDLSGTTVDLQGRPSSGCTVAVFPDDARMRFESRRSRLLRADQNGRFRVSDLPEGSYVAAATPDVDAAVWLTTDYLSRLQTVAARVSLTGRERKTITLSCTSVP